MWNDLTMSERADVIKMAVKAGLRDMKSIRKFYDDSLKYAEGGPKVTYDKPYYSYDKNMQVETDNGKPILNYSATLPEVNIIPDSKKSPADRNEAKRFREKVFSDNAEREARDYTQRQIMKSQRDWNNSLEKKALGYAQDAMTGIGIGADIVSGLPIYSSLKGSRVLSEASSLPEYIEGGLWLAPIGGVVGKEAYSVGKTGIVKAVEGLQNNLPGMFDPYTSFGATFGNYGNNIFSKMYGTLARRYNLPDKVRLPADTMRKLKEGVHINNGVIDLTGGKAYTGKPHVNSTTDRGVVSHSLGQWEGADTYITPTKNFIEQAGNSLKSIEPSDMFSNGVRITESPQNTVLISGDIEALQRAKEIGMQTLSSPRLRKLYAEQLSKYKVEKEAFDKAYSEASGIQRQIMKEPSTPKYKKWWSDYTNEQQRLQQLRGTPTLKDYQLLEDITGLKSGTAPIEEMSNAVKKLEEMSNATILDITNGSILPYTYPNGRVVDWTKAAKELELVKKAKYSNVFYDPASTVEFDWQRTLSNKKAEGGSIHIAPSKRGTFTAVATKHGMGVQEFASKVLANKDNYSPTMVKKANFAKNASKWKHDLGGWLFEEGGPKSNNREYKSANSWSTANLHKIFTPVSTALMNFGRFGELSTVWKGGTPEETYLLPKNIQRQEFLSRGYTEAPNDYGLVKKAVGNKDVPVYQTKADDISRQEVFPIGNIDSIWYGKKEAALERPGSYPTAVYYSPYTNEYYQKGWDLNDYGGGSGAYNKYDAFGKIKADIADVIGSPVVTTTGISNIGSLDKMMKEEETSNIATEFLKSKGLVPMKLDTKELPFLNLEGRPVYDLKGKPVTYTIGEYVPSLPEVTIIGKRRKKVK